MARLQTANDLINQVAVEVGLGKVADPLASPDFNFQQLAAIANQSGWELSQAAEWQSLNRSHQIITQSTDTGKYPLPDDFAYMVDQTGWEHTDRRRMAGPLSPQQWTYLRGRDLVAHTIQVSFRQNQGEFWVFPYAENPGIDMPDGLDINFEYQSRNWVREQAQAQIGRDSITRGSDIVLFDPYLFQRLLKLRFLEAKGFDTTKASDQYVLALESWKGKDKGAPTLSLHSQGMGEPYLDGMRNTPDTGFGSP